MCPSFLSRGKSAAFAHLKLRLWRGAGVPALEMHAVQRAEQAICDFLPRLLPPAFAALPAADKDMARKPAVDFVHRHFDMCASS